MALIHHLTRSLCQRGLSLIPTEKRESRIMFSLKGKVTLQATGLDIPTWGLKGEQLFPTEADLRLKSSLFSVVAAWGLLTLFCV